tara:strand:+ start:469 stop:648 length:180 start_codon:yes stop_codon:yes gene_type:complete
MNNDLEFLSLYERDLTKYFGWSPSDKRLQRLLVVAQTDPGRAKRHHQQILQMINRDKGV